MRSLLFWLCRHWSRLVLMVMCKLDIKEIEYPTSGRLVLVSNHVSLIDSLIISVAINRPMRFVMYYKYYNIPVFKSFFKALGAIPIAGKSEDPEVFFGAFKEISSALNNDEAVFIFPEGILTTTGELCEFKGGIEHILKKTPSPVLPLALKGLWGSKFSKSKSRSLFSFKRRKVEVIGGCLIQPENCNRITLKQVIAKLLYEK
ncbi:hypothetical protein VCHA53O466_50474 [Vibrio chagasii]|nr:hypothetical protein VCHA53O466_50474 [Vibrio chagasii]